MSIFPSDHPRLRVPGRIASLLLASLIAWPVALHTGCEGGSTGVDNPGLTELPVEFRDEAGDMVLVQGALEVYDRNHNPAVDSAPLLRRQVEVGQVMRLTAGEFDLIRAGRTPKQSALSKQSAASRQAAASGPAATDSLIRFNLVFRSASGSGAMVAGLSYDPILKRFFLESRATAGVRMLPKPLLRFTGSLHREAVHGTLGRIILPGTPFQATLVDSDFVLESLTEGRFPMRLLGAEGYMYAVRESLDTHVDRGFSAETVPIGRVDGIIPPAGFGVETEGNQSVYAGENLALKGRLLGIDSNDSRISIQWRFLDKPLGDSARIVDPTRLSTTFNTWSGLSATIVHTLELSATFGAATVRDTLLVKVTPQATGMFKFVEPQPGDTVVQNQPFKVGWGYANSELVRLEVSYKEGSWSIIADSIPNTFQYTEYQWLTPQSGGLMNTCLLRLKAIPSDTVLGVMYAPFVLIPAP